MEDKVNDPAQDISTADTWTVLESWKKGVGFVRQQIDSYNHFVQSTIPEFVQLVKPLRFHCEKQGEILEFELGQVCHSSPTTTPNDLLFPNSCLLRGLTYSMPLTMEVTKRLISST